MLDVGCGTGTFALMLPERGTVVIGLDPAGASLGVARSKPGADRVRWVHGDATAVKVDLREQVDLALMTGNVAQAIADENDWARTLQVVRGCLRPGGHLVLETRRPGRRAWQEWTCAQSETVTEVGWARDNPAVGAGGRGGPAAGQVRVGQCGIFWIGR